MNDLTDILDKIGHHEDLSPDEAADALNRIVSGEVNQARTAAFLYGMRAKGETPDELAAFVRVMRQHAVQVDVNLEDAVDLCGTGGDGSGTFNISTAAMFVVAGTDVPVLKHGNRSVSSSSGSVDVLEQLGARPEMDKNGVEQCFRETGMAFMFAPLFHPAMKQVMPARKELGMRTFFNVLGPLLNPAGVRRQLVGAYNKQTAETIIRILEKLDTEFAYAVHGMDGMDEFTTVDKTLVYQFTGKGEPHATEFDPGYLGFSYVSPQQLQGGDAARNADIVRAVLENRAEDAQKEIVMLNATFAIHASGVYEDLNDAHLAAEESLESGRAQQALERFVICTADLAQNRQEEG